MIHWPGLLKMHWLRKRPVTCGIPRGETDPLLAGGVERNAVVKGSEGRERRRGYDLTPGGLSISPDQLDELARPGPVHVGDKGALRASP